jgi:hypothetical protein
VCCTAQGTSKSGAVEYSSHLDNICNSKSKTESTTKEGVENSPPNSLSDMMPSLRYYGQWESCYLLDLRRGRRFVIAALLGTFLMDEAAVFMRGWQIFGGRRVLNALALIITSA